MGYELRAASRGYDLAQIERDWTMAQARIDALAEAGTEAIQRLVQDAIECAERADATSDQRATVQAIPGSYDIDHLAEAV
jgi:6,7-dimethyl-8-ribityllumazine synthase